MLLSESKPIGQSEPFRLRAQLANQPCRSGGLVDGGQWVWELLGAKVPLEPYDGPVSDAGSLASPGRLSAADRR
jgi:hypothetical protein